MKKLLSIIALATTLGNVQIDAQSKTNAHMLGTDPSTYTPTGAHMLGTDPSTYTPTNTHMLGTDPSTYTPKQYMRESTERVARERKIPQLKYKKAPVTPESINSALSQLYSAANKTLEQSHNYETSVNVVIVVQHYSQMFFQTSYNIEIDKLLKEALDDLTKIQSYKKV